MRFIFSYVDGPNQVFDNVPKYLGKGATKTLNPEYVALNRKLKYRLFGRA